MVENDQASSVNVTTHHSAIRSSGLTTGAGFRCRTSLGARFPANREINREFRHFCPSAVIFALRSCINSMVYGQIPYASNREFFEYCQGKFGWHQGNK